MILGRLDARDRGPGFTALQRSTLTAQLTLSLAYCLQCNRTAVIVQESIAGFQVPVPDHHLQPQPVQDRPARVTPIIYCLVAVLCQFPFAATSLRGVILAADLHWTSVPYGV